MSIITIKKRHDFLLSHKAGKKQYRKYLNIQCYHRKDSSEAVFFGFTITKKIAAAIMRNKIKRRLKSIIAFLIKNKKDIFVVGCNYVFIGKPNIIEASFEELKEDVILGCNNLYKSE